MKGFILKFTGYVLVFFVSSIVCTHLMALKISVIVPCDSKHIIHLERLLDLYEQQTVLPNEIVVSVSRVDRNVQEFLNNLLRIERKIPVICVTTGERLYAGENRNRACARATGDIFVCQDADDEPHPQRIEAIRYIFEKYKVDHIIHSYLFTTESQNQKEKTINCAKMKVTIPRHAMAILKIKKLHHGNVAIRKRVFQKVKWSKKQKGQDVEFNKNVFKNRFKSAVVFEPLLIYRVENSSWKRCANSSLVYPYNTIDPLPFDGSGHFGSAQMKGLSYLIHTYQPHTVVEIGSYLGASTRYIAKLLPENGRVYAVDHWLGNSEWFGQPNYEQKQLHFYRQFLSNVIHENLCHKIIPVKMASVEAAASLTVSPDLIFIDGSHDYESVYQDICVWYKVLDQQGVLCGDDYYWGKDHPVKKAVDRFAKEHGLMVKLIDKWVWYYERTL